MEKNKQNTLEEINQKIILNAPIQKVWETVTTSEGIAAWFMPNDFVLAEGHEFHLQSPFGPSPCKVLEIDEPTKLTFSWDTEGWIVDFLLKDLDGQTEFTLIHRGWKQPDEIVGKANETSQVIRDRMNQGWVGLVNVRLKQAVEG